MSVLYKALQKAAKENEQRQPAAPAAGFDPERLAGSGVIRAGASRGKWRIASLLFLLVAVVAMGAAYYFTVLTPPEPQVAANRPRPRPTLPPTAPASTPSSQPATPAESQATPPAAQTPTPATQPATQQAATAVTPPATPTTPATSAPQTPTQPASPAVVAAATPTPVPPAAKQSVESAQPPSAEPTAKAPAAEPAKTTAKSPTNVPPPKAPAKALSTREPMPKLAVDSPARMLDPPINIHRNQMDLEGVGAAVRVRTVSQAAQDTVGSAYNALIRGQYDTALGFYDQALKQEPRSMLALLGRGAALQKLGRKDDARGAYEQVLKIDPENREALSNITALEAERAPGEALQRLMDLERDYPNFSPIKAQIGMVYARLENYDGALDYLRRAVAMTPEATLYQYNLALVLDRLGRPEEAVEAYQQVLSALSAGRTLPELSTADIQRRVDYLRGK